MMPTTACTLGRIIILTRPELKLLKKMDTTLRAHKMSSSQSFCPALVIPANIILPPVLITARIRSHRLWQGQQEIRCNLGFKLPYLNVLISCSVALRKLSEFQIHVLHSYHFTFLNSDCALYELNINVLEEWDLQSMRLNYQKRHFWDADPIDTRGAQRIAPDVMVTFVSNI